MEEHSFCAIDHKMGKDGIPIFNKLDRTMKLIWKA